MFDANACAVELLKMKNSEDIQNKVATASSVVKVVEGECVEATLKIATDPDLKMTKTISNSSSLLQDAAVLTPIDKLPSSDNDNAPTPMDISSKDDAHAPPETAKVPDTDKMETDEGPVATPIQQKQQQPPPPPKSVEESPAAVVPPPPPDPVSSAPTKTVNVSSGSSNNNSNLTTATTSSTTSVVSINEDGDRMTNDSSSDEEEDEIYMNQFTRDNMGSENNDPSSTEEAVIKRNTEYLTQRCTSLMNRVQGIMQATAARHVSRQLKSILENPGLNQNRVRNLHYQGRLSGPQLPDNGSDKLSKQAISELQFAVKLMTNIIRHSMSNQLDPNNDSATEESDSDDDEVVLPDERLMADPSNSSDYSSYLPAENNPFIEAIKLEKQYEARRTALDCSINECEFSLTKSLALRKHCKASKPLFQLKKPTASSNVINIPVDSSSSVKFYHDTRPVIARRCNDNDNDDGISNSTITSLDISRVSDMMQEQDKSKPTSGGSAPGPKKSSTDKADQSLSNKVAADLAVLSDVRQESQAGDGQQDHNAFIPSLKTFDSGGASVLGVAFVTNNKSDPNQSSSRCSAIKRPDKNRKVFQLGGIHNIFRDPAGLPSVSCTCFGRNELCALCLGRAQKKSAINHVFMNRRDKISILDETFHKTLSFGDDVPLEPLLTSNAMESANVMPKTLSVQQIIKKRSQHFPPDFLETGPKPKKPRTYDIKPYVESPVPSPKKDNRFGDEHLQSIRKRPIPRKSQSSFEERDATKVAGKGLGFPTRERKDSMRRNRNQEYDIDNIVIPYSIAAATRVEQLVYKPIETPRWRVLDYSEIFSSVNEDKNDGELEDMSNAAFLHRHNKCEVDEKKRFTISLQKALNSTRKTRRLDSTCRSESTGDNVGMSGNPLDTQVQSPGKPREKDVNVSLPSTPTPAGDEQKGTSSSTPVAENATVITEAMATQALKSLFKIGRRRTISTTSTKPEEEEESAPEQVVDPWPQRKFPLAEEDYREMVETMKQCDLEDVRKSRNDEILYCDDSLGSPPAGL